MIWKRFHEKSTGKRRNAGRPSLALVLGLALCLHGVSPPGWGWGIAVAERFDVAELYFELNNTDGDLGIHCLIDGEPWRSLEIEDPKGRNMLNIFVQGRLERQGLTELFFESAEPPFDELPPEKFFDRFPEGKYKIAGKSLEGPLLRRSAVLTHVMPAPPENITVNGNPTPESCDKGPVLRVSEPLLIKWDKVTSSHPTIGKAGPVEVVRYQVVLEREESNLKFSADLPPNVARFRVPTNLFAPGDEVKLEILVREKSGNQTAIETCFTIE